MAREGEKLNVSRVIREMAEYYEGQPERINHFMKVYGFAKTIGELEEIPPQTLDILEAAAAVHDIGIKISEEKYNSCAGRYQELEGPPVAGELLRRCGYREELIERICYLVGHHHTYSNMDGLDYQILVEADFLVNLYEQKEDRQAILHAKENIFRTKSGTELLERLFPDVK
ncbi:HD domain-containing protein [Lachnospiraceae bacterium ASD3451]|uniref:HD domain-containing protein n=1 Tax=Diplocloster agilis TaxID=2850323 RepID=A0A949K3M5_9FIRM|nr:HD domain-containing protein [Diplocloster agilis]MBU9743720.1 HD domain-containing protein [Diplocloster agilis]